MSIKFEVGGVYKAWNTLDDGGIQRREPVKVIDITARCVYFQMEFKYMQIMGAKIYDLGSGEEALSNDGCQTHVYVDSSMPYCLHPFYPSENSFCKACFDLGLLSTRKKVRRFHKKIMKTFVLFFFYFKIIVLARRAKRVVMERMERMYAPGGIGFVAAQESFYRAAKSQRIE